MKKNYISVISVIAAISIMALVLGLIKQTTCQTLLVDIWDSVMWLTFALVFHFEIPFWLAKSCVLVALSSLPLLVYFISHDVLSRLYIENYREVSK